MLAGRLDRGQVMRDEDQRGSLLQDVAQALEATLLERGVADGQHLVHEQHVGLEERGDAEAEPHLHADRVELDLPVDRLMELRELDDVVEPALDLAARKSHQRPSEVDVLAPRELRRNPGTHLDQCPDPARDGHPARRRVHDPGE